MHALNAYFHKHVPEKDRDAIYLPDIGEYFSKQPGVINRDISKERGIKINPLVDGTSDTERAKQMEILTSKGMTFAAMEEVALVIAVYACKNRGKDLLQDNWTRTVAPGVALETAQDDGVGVHRFNDDDGFSLVCASGVLASSN